MMSSMQRPVLILGAKGMLGKALGAVFADLKPTLWDKEDIDITDQENTKNKVLDLQPGVILNCAAMTDVDACEENAEPARKLNAQAPGFLAHVANEADATLVQFSTAYVFDGKKREGYRESDTPRPISFYGQTKLEGEHNAASAHRHYIVRLDRLFGVAGAGKKSFVDKMLEAANSQKQLTVIDEELGSPTYTPDLAARVRFILEQQLPYGVYHCTNAGACTWYEFATEIFRVAGIAVDVISVSSSVFPRKAERPKFGVLLNTKLPPMRPWQEALAEYLH